MEGLKNPRVIGAFAMGLAITALTYVYTNYGNTPTFTNNESVDATASGLQARQAVAVTDNDGNGIEDWRDALVAKQPTVQIRQPSTDFTPSDTLTGKTGIALLESVLRDKMYSPVSEGPEAAIQSVIEQTKNQIQDKVYTADELNIINEDPEIVRNYANLAMLTMQKHNVPGSESELIILKRALDRNNPDVLDDLDPIITAYQGMRDDFLNLPVPPSMAAQHLDLINIFNALHNDIEGMKQALSDPILGLIRIRRYESDAEGFGFALRNLAIALEPYSSVFRPNDPALGFVVFHPDFNQNSV